MVLCTDPDLKFEFSNFNNHFIYKIVYKDYVNVNDTQHLHVIGKCIFCDKTIIICRKDICSISSNIKCNQVNPNSSNLMQINQNKINEIVNHKGKKCNCFHRKISCLDEQEWIKYQMGIIKFSYRTIDYGAKKIHPAIFPIDLPKYFIKLLTHEGELIVDPFGGSGTTIQAASELSRYGISIDLSNYYNKFAKTRPIKDPNNIIIDGDSRIISKLFPINSIDLIITSPPYANLLNKRMTHRSRKNRDRDHSPRQYSQKTNDLGILEIDSFIIEFNKIMKEFYSKLKPKGHLIINVCNDIYDKSVNKNILFPSKIIEALEKIGYKYKNKIIWDRTEFFKNAHGFGYPSNFLIFSGSYEIIIDFVKE